MVAPDRSRLRAAFRLPRADVAPRGPAPDPRADLRAFLRRRLPALPGLPRVALPAGCEAGGEHGPFWRRELRYPLDTLHGRQLLGRALGVDRQRLAALGRAPELARLEPGQLLFLDTETTGLGGGAGTVVFAVGLARFCAGELQLEQLFLRDFNEEPAMLQHVARRLREHALLVTYVGKSFDRHRIAARLAVHRIQAPVLTAPHLDLYHVARRVYGRQLPDCRLRTVEEHKLGLVRTDDLPGSEAPAAFLQWLRDGTGAIDRVLEHNRLDVLSVVALLGVLAADGG